MNRVDSSISSKRGVINSNSESVCKTCNKCVNSASHGMCFVNILNSVNATPTVRIVLNKEKQIWKPKGKLSDNNISYQWRPTGKKLLRKLSAALVFLRGRPTGKKFSLRGNSQLTKPFCCSKHMTGNRSKTHDFVEKFIGTDILKGSRGTNLYTISIDEMMKSSPICLLSKASKSKSWLWHRRLNHLNFGTINDLARKDLLRST
ncbi:integrase, catalytic region, zinc finger, CCHC-type containing protein [Tanacetum coccineum]